MQAEITRREREAGSGQRTLHKKERRDWVSRRSFFANQLTLVVSRSPEASAILSGKDERLDHIGPLDPHQNVVTRCGEAVQLA